MSDKYEAVPPTARTEKHGGLEHQVLEHPAFGAITLTHVTGRRDALFGSDVGGFGCVRIAIHKAALARDISRDRVCADHRPILVLEMSHAQFGQFITSAGATDGTPVTLLHAPPGAPVRLPAIKKVETKQDLLRQGITDRANEAIADFSAEVGKLEKMLEDGKIPIKAFREAVRQLRIRISNMPTNLSHVIEMAEETLEEATAAAKIEVESFIAARSRSIGVDILAQAALEQDPKAPDAT